MYRLVALLALLPLLALTASGASAQKRSTDIRIEGATDGRLVERLDPRDAELAITTRDGKLSLLLSHDALTMQLTDRGLREVRREVEKDTERDAEEGLLGRVIATVVRSSVRSMLDHGLRFHLDDLEDARYEKGRLVITDREGVAVLDSVEIDDRDAMEGFAPDDARAFVREFRRLKSRARRTV